MNREPHDRKNLRLPGYDYNRQGRYFVTICVQRRECILGSVGVGGGVPDAPCVQLSVYGQIVNQQIREINACYEDVQVERYVIMPNHVHMVVEIRPGPSRTPAPTETAHTIQQGPSRTPAPTARRLPALISTLKRFTNKKCGFPFWQRGYFEHILRNDDELRRVIQYIEENPRRWREDRYYNEPGILTGPL